MLEKKQRSTLFNFLDALSLLLSEVQDSSKLFEVTEKVNVAFALMEQDFSMAIQVLSVLVATLHAEIVLDHH